LSANAAHGKLSPEWFLGRWEMKQIKSLGLLPICLLASVVSTFAAEITVKADGGLPTVKLTGDIDAQTPEALEKALNYLQPFVDRNISDFENEARSLKGQMAGLMGAQLYLNSGGGDVDAAMRAGEIARAYHVTISIPLDSSCASACVLLLVGGPSRIVIGRVGIHRPYSSTYSSSLSVSDQRYRAVNAAVEKYLRAMNMPARLIEVMNAVSPDQIRWLTESEADEFGIGVDDPVWKDRWDSVNAQSRGISKQEYYSRLQRARAQCAAIYEEPAHGQCYFGIVGFPR
jgi:hypothetical protein